MDATPGRLSDFKRIHFIGVGGIGMSALARLCLHEGKRVSGSDRAPSAITETLQNEGVIFFTAQVAANITKDIELVVYTEAMPQDHEELVAAREKQIPLMNYFDALGMVANEYYLIAVSGTHGKTTTTSMLIDICEDAGLDPTAIVGSLRARTRSNFRAGKSKYFIVEACEYKRDFMSLKPDILIITNVEHEHVDYYKNLDDVQSAFRELALQVREGGAVILDFGAPNIAPILQGLTVRLIDYGTFFDPLRALRVPGIHNQLNAAAAIAAASLIGISTEVANETLARFENAWRRFEYKGEYNGAPVYDDYGHHPTEIKATLQGARERHPDKRITLVFQPHTYSRVRELFDDFVRELGKADRILLAPIYAAREVNESGVSSKEIEEHLNAQAVDATAYESFDAIVRTLKEDLTEDDLLLIMGAGNITDIADILTHTHTLGIFQPGK